MQHQAFLTVFYKFKKCTIFHNNRIQRNNTSKRNQFLGYSNEMRFICGLKTSFEMSEERQDGTFFLEELDK